VKVAAIQHDVVWEDRDANLARLGPMVAAAAAAGARLAVLSEMFSTGFTMATDRMAEPVDGPSTQFLVDRATAYGLWVGGSIPVRDEGFDPRPTNCFVLAAPDGTVTRYRKRHPFSKAGEHEHYAPGDELVTVDVEGVRTSLFVCYDLRFGADWWQLAPDTDCYLVVASWPAIRREHWRTLVRARAIENQAYVVAVNRVGEGDRVRYRGDSMVIGPFGAVLADPGDGEQVVCADVDPAVVASTRERFPFLSDRRA
jgi:predicted amidohydrolase